MIKFSTWKKQTFCEHEWVPLPMTRNALDYWKSRDCLGFFYYYCSKCDKTQLRTRDGQRKYKARYGSLFAPFELTLHEVVLPVTLLTACSQIIERDDLNGITVEHFSQEDLEYNEADWKNSVESQFRNEENQIASEQETKKTQEPQEPEEKFETPEIQNLTDFMDI